MKRSQYIVTILRLQDDYKLSYGAEIESIAAFSTHAYAETYLKQKLREIIQEHIDDTLEMDAENPFQDMCTDDRLNTDINMCTIASLVKRSSAGEYIPYTVRWSIDETKLDEHVPENAKSK